MNAFRRWLIVQALLLPVSVLAASTAQVQPHEPQSTTAAGRELDELDPVIIEGAPLKGRAAIAAWFRRMAGTYRDAGTLSYTGGPTVAVQGMTECVIFGTGPGLQCVVNERSADGVMQLSPGMFLFGLDLDRPRILGMGVVNLGFGESGTAELRGDTATFRMACWEAKSCYRTTSITAKPNSNQVRMKVETEVNGRVIMRYDIIKTRLPKTDSAAQAAGRDGPPAGDAIAADEDASPDDARDDDATDNATAPDATGTATDSTDATGTADSADDPPPPGNYTEPLCRPLASVSDLAAAYTPARLRSTLEALALRRYPYGLAPIQTQSDQQLMSWFRSTATFQDVLDHFGTAVHEGIHLWGFVNGNGIGNYAYRVRDDLIIATRRFNNFNRSEILRIHPDTETDRYDETYLTGSSGAQGFNTLLDEFNAYVHSLATGYCLRDQLRPGQRVSARDGVLTMMFYVEAYLALARTRHARDYAAITRDANHVRLLLTLWSRAEFYLHLTRSMPQLGIRDAAISRWVYHPDNLMEIERLRSKERP